MCYSTAQAKRAPYSCEDWLSTTTRIGFFTKQVYDPVCFNWSEIRNILVLRPMGVARITAASERVTQEGGCHPLIIDEYITDCRCVVRCAGGRHECWCFVYLAYQPPIFSDWTNHQQSVSNIFISRQININHQPTLSQQSGWRRRPTAPPGLVT
jgi:hypothetical protein